MDNNQNNFDPVTGQPIQNTVNNQQQVNPQYQQVPNYNPEPKKKSPLKIILLVLGGFILFFVILFCVIYFVITGSSKKLVCKSNEGDITIMYNQKEVTGYVANGMSYDLDGQKEIAKQIGVKEYIDQFEAWFITNTTGSCERK